MHAIAQRLLRVLYTLSRGSERERMRDDKHRKRTSPLHFVRSLGVPRTPKSEASNSRAEPLGKLHLAQRLPNF
ncbi:hypothetical protein NDU88_006209 [Pleurodeles waltl]|uniref:Uncharacterized protein n=1 Tax=Pleurodeles waltl TaxID=8319 RepID=A0AAV7WA42_PLEWA|nr:hypothetical protein NDU88_006209 [Pleurodeles waltl]